MKRLAAAALLLLAACGVRDGAVAPPAAACAPGLAPGTVTTLFFGLSRPNRPDVAEADWQDFLSREIMTRMAGATVVDGRGLFRAPGAAPAAEPARVVVLGHRGGAGTERALSEIAEHYKRRFDQWGVGRTDTAACTNFE